MKKIYSIILIGFVIIGGFGAVALQNDSGYESGSFNDSYIVSQPVITTAGDFISISLQEATSSVFDVGKPVLPVISRVFTLPFGSRVDHVSVIFSDQHQITISKEVMPYAEPKPVTSSGNCEGFLVKDTSVYIGQEIFPSTQYTYDIVAGLAADEHVFYLVVQCYPVVYSPQNNLIYSFGKIDLSVEYQQPTQSVVFPDEYDFAIIAPEDYTSPIEPLIAHKEDHELKTLFMTTEQIYSEYPGRDNQEQIKYFIEDAVKNLGVTYVLIIGSVYKVPIRTSAVSMWGRWQEDTLTDLYYSDLFDGTGEFSTWDTDEDNIFGETEDDQLDLYPDVHIGRLACDTISEVEIVVDKIIHYEDESYGKDWFHDMIFIGGNTFRWNPGNEGEELNEMVMDIMSDFNPSYIIWTSKGNFNRRTISEAISAGAGFMDYSGHGFEHGMGTYPPFGPFLRTYLTPYINDLVNGYELPIMFFDACLTAKLDFVLQDVLDYKQYRVFDILANIFNYNTSMRLPCYAWCFIKLDGGGAIATIGATRTAFGGVDSGAGKMSLEFFGSYHSSQRVGQMMTKAQNAYITDVPDDQFTVEEFILLGDPSLMVGGYP